jgi:hypothetical protein
MKTRDTSAMTVGGSEPPTKKIIMPTSKYLAPRRKLRVQQGNLMIRQ